MQLFKIKPYTQILLLAAFTLALSGCATSGSHFRMDPLLNKSVVTLGGGDYLPLDKVCDAYGLNYKWDDLTRVVTLERQGKKIVLREGSAAILVDGRTKQLGLPVEFSSGKLFVPVNFARSGIGPVAGPSRRISAPRPEAPKRFAIKTIMLDPGHGGKDAGALGRKSRIREKDLALKLALKVRKILENKGIRVVMTRSDDTFIPLSKRASMANKSGADLFVSIHINASRSRSLRGFECYFLSNATDDNARALEAFEDSSLKLGESAVAERSKHLDKTLWDMMLTENRIESAELASHICSAVESSRVISSRGVRSARFYVLKHTNMPAVLVEAGYLSNRYDENKIRGAKFLDRMAEAVTDGILRYKGDYEKTEGYTRL